MGYSEEIGIIVPVYGVEEYVDRFMQSLMNQTIQNFMLVIVNDCTLDNSMRKINDYIHFWKNRIVVINNKNNVGLSGARNVGLDYLYDYPTKYVTFLDPDDWVEEDYLEDLFDLSEKNTLDLCISGVIRFNCDRNRVMCKEMVRMESRVYQRSDECYELGYINPCVYSKLFRFDAIKDIRFRNIKRSEDTCYLFECLSRYKRIMFTNNARYHYCMRSNSLTGTIGKDKYYSMHEGFQRALNDIRSCENASIVEQFVAQIFIRSSLGGVCRVCFNDMKNVKSMEREELNYLDKYVPEWRQNKYLSFGKGRINNIKEFALKLLGLMYRKHIFRFFVYIYNVFLKISGKDIRA